MKIDGCVRIDEFRPQQQFIGPHIQSCFFEALTHGTLGRRLTWQALPAGKLSVAGEWGTMRSDTDEIATAVPDDSDPDGDRRILDLRLPICD